jgi:hypothetical protein
MSDMVLMPKELTAENGAKALLIGEFHVYSEVPNADYDPEDHDEDEEPEFFTEQIPVPWDTIKKIYAMAVQHLAKDPTHGQGDVPRHLVPEMEKIQRMADRLQKAESLLKRAYNGMHKEHWREGESESEVCQAILAFLGSVPLHDGGCIQSFDCNAGDHSDCCPGK